MKALITGMKGTVAPAVAGRLRASGVSPIAWDRTCVPPDDEHAVRHHLQSVRPDWMLHIGMGSPAWAAWLAEECAALGIRFLYTGSVSVFDNRKPGPFPPERAPDAPDEYGRYKAECERRVQASNGQAIIVRLGWQIGDAAGSNNLLDYLVRTGREKGQVELSGGLIHSHSFLADTAEAIIHLLEDFAPGLYQLEGNPGLSLYEVGRRLAKMHRLPFPIVEQPEPRRDTRMVDPRIRVSPLDARLPA